MRICHVTDAFYPRIGGVERMVSGLAKAQLEMGCEVRVITRAEPGSAAREVVKGVGIHRVPFAARPTPLAYRSTVAGVRRALIEMCGSDFVPEVVHTHLTLTGTGAMQAATAKGLPLVATFYGPWDKEFKTESEPLRKRGALYGLYLDWLAGKQRGMQSALLRAASERIVLSSHSLIEMRERFGALDAERIPGGVDLGRFRPHDAKTARKKLGWPEQGIMLVSLRRLVRRMGLGDLIRSVGMLAGEGLDLHLAVAGEGPLEDELRRLAGELGLGDRVLFMGGVADELVPLALSAADLFVLPSIAEEHFGLVILESIACGTPVVGTPVGAIPETLGGFSRDLTAGGTGPEALASAIGRALTGLDELSALCRGDWRRRLEGEHSWKAIAARTAEVYERSRPQQAGASG